MGGVGQEEMGCKREDSRTGKELIKQGGVGWDWKTAEDRREKGTREGRGGQEAMRCEREGSRTGKDMIKQGGVGLEDRRRQQKKKH